MKIDVIITTYNSPEYLKKVLIGLENQIDKDFSVIIADDGSGIETKNMIEEFIERKSLNIEHVWHEDEGFQKCKILNKAIIYSKAEYLIFLDGDCVPSKNMVQTHRKFARKNRYITGGKVLLSQKFTNDLTENDIINEKLEKIGWWWFYTKRIRRLLLSKIPFLRELFDRNVKRMPGWRGENASTYRHHILEVGGFDERFTYGYEDADFGHRLSVNGVRGFSIRYISPVFHLEHKRPYNDSTKTKINYNLYLENRKKNISLTEYGIKIKKERDEV